MAGGAELVIKARYTAALLVLAAGGGAGGWQAAGNGDRETVQSEPEGRVDGSLCWNCSSYGSVGVSFVLATSESCEGDRRTGKGTVVSLSVVVVTGGK